MSRGHGWIVHRFERVASTMDTAAQLARLGAPDRTAVIATEQTAGRGRGGRSWQSPPGAALFCTTVLRPAVAPNRLTTLPLIAGIAVAEALEQVTTIPVQLKWPNDVWMGTNPERRKVAGILATSQLSATRVEYALIGVGINIGGTLARLPAGATNLLVTSGVESTPADVLAVVLDRLDVAYTTYCDAGGRPSLEAWRARAALLGEEVTIEDAGRQYAGVFVDIDDAGAFLLKETGDSIRRVVAGDVARGPRLLTTSQRG